MAQLLSDDLRASPGGGWRHVATGSGVALRDRSIKGDQVGPRVAPDRQLSAEAARRQQLARTGSRPAPRCFWRWSKRPRT